MFVEEVMELIELNELRDALVGSTGMNGLSTGQRKRLTVAVELVANPSIIFMDEPTTGLDARAVAIVMRPVRNTVNIGRTVVSPIQQPSIDIFEAFDERKSHICWRFGRNSHKLMEYFEAIPGGTKIADGCNPATWMLEISSPSVEMRLDLDLTKLYYSSSVYQRSQALIKELSAPLSGFKDLFFPTKYNQELYCSMHCLFLETTLVLLEESQK